MDFFPFKSTHSRNMSFLINMVHSALGLNPTLPERLSYCHPIYLSGLCNGLELLSLLEALVIEKPYFSELPLGKGLGHLFNKVMLALFCQSFMELKCIPFSVVCGQNFYVAQAVNSMQEWRPLRRVAQTQIPCVILGESVANSQECGEELQKLIHF